MFTVFLAGWKLCLRRIVADYWVVVTAAVTVLLAVTALAAGPIYAEAMYVAGARQRLLDAPVADANVAVSSGLGNEQFAALDQRVTAALAPVVTPTDGPIYRGGVSTAFSLPDDVAAGVAVDGEQTPLAVFAFQEGIEQRARLMEGAWEGSDASIVNVVVSEASAVALGLQVGDRLAVQGRFDKEHHPDIEIVGIFRIDDPADSYWYDDELLLRGVSTGESFTTFGPLIVSRETFLDQFARLADFHCHALPDFDRPYRAGDTKTQDRRPGRWRAAGRERVER